MSTRYKWAGEQGELTRGDYGVRIEVVHRLSWDNASNGWIKDPNGDEFGVFDPDFGWIIVRQTDVGEVMP